MPLFRLFLAAALLAATAILACGASARAQGASPQQQPPALDPGNTEGLKPFEIACKPANANGESEEISNFKWNGGAIPEDACPPGTMLLKYYAAEIVTGMSAADTPPETKAGGDD